MAKIKIRSSDIDIFQKAIKSKLDAVMTQVFIEGANQLLPAQAEIFKNIFANHPEYIKIKTDPETIGQYGFTPEEVAKLDRILELMVPATGQGVTKIVQGVSNRTRFMTLEWVDYPKLVKHPYTQHRLSILNTEGQTLRAGELISWAKWLQEGLTIAEYEFSNDPEDLDRSRSGEGIMKKTGRMFILEPSRIFDQIPIIAENGIILDKGFGLLFRKVAKTVI